MNSITKRKLSFEEIQDLARQVFGEEIYVKSHTDLADGWYNSAYLIVLSDMRQVILKISPPSNVKNLTYEKNIMDTEVEVLRLIKNIGTIPVPEVLYYDNSKRILDSEYFFMEKIDGVPYNNIKESLPETERNEIERQLGIYNKLINDIEGEKFGYFAANSKRSDNWPEAFINMLDDILNDGKEYNVKLPLEYNKIKELIMTNLSVFDEVVAPQLVHWDLWDGNVFINNENKIAGIIDFERALWGDPLMEVYFGDMFRSESFCKGYGRDTLTSEKSKIRRIIYNIYVYLILFIECDYRKYGDEKHKKWTHDLLEKELNLLLEITK